MTYLTPEKPFSHVEKLSSEHTSAGKENPGTLLHVEKPEQRSSIWHAPVHDYPREVCTPTLIARQAQERPQATALVAPEGTLSYAQLDRRANRLAHHLRTLGVGPNVLVGLYLERSLDMVVGLLGILKAGGAYVPIDPAYPRERVVFMLQDACAPVLVTHTALAADIAVEGTTLVCLDRDGSLLEGLPETEPASAPIQPADLAYVIYTSGSTGRPKGVQITHDSLLNLIYWHQRAFAVTAADRATQVTSPAFDATGWELWPYLTCGATIYLPNDETRVDPPAMRDWLVAQEITIAFLPTPLAESIIQLAWPAQTALRLLLTGADTLHHYPRPGLPFTLVNNYGPTETTVVATSGAVAPRSCASSEAPSIGYAIDNTSIYLLDEQMRPVSFGEPGELYIGGLGVARGYLNRPELTAERFLNDPFSTRPGARMYRTGDCARFLSDGQLAFLGRIDHQIKLRGYRIEPGEIISALNDVPGIQTSMVIAREDLPGEKRLVAYVVLAEEAAVTASTVREALAERLPEYMIPAVFVQLSTLPLTANGKIDRAALPAPDEQNLLPEDECERSDGTPATPIEEQVARIICTLLGRDHIHVDDNFFMLGGHSLLGAQLVLRISEAFGIELPLHTLFNAPTVRQLSAEIEERLVAWVAGMSDQEALDLLEQTTSN
jgi:amino acid adenylation domain-containing protein